MSSVFPRKTERRQNKNKDIERNVDIFTPF